MGTVLRVDHGSDLINQYAQTFREKFVFRDFYRNFPNHRIISVLNGSATKYNINVALNIHRVDFISASGHGDYDAFTGHDGKPIWHATEPMGPFKNKIVHLLACDAGAMLGRSIVEGGGLAFWGYTVNFTFRHFRNPPSLDGDTLAEVFLKMDAIIDRGVLVGKNSREIFSSVSNYVAYMLQQSTSFTDPIDRGLLLSNFVHLACPSMWWGDKAAVIK